MNGRAKEAIEYYQEALNAKVLFKQTFGEGPEDESLNLTEDEKGLVAHSILKIGETQIMIADMIPGLTITTGNQVSICITTSEISLTKQLYENLKKDGKVLIELSETHFSPAWGMVTDKFGVTFQVYTSRK
jgi:PhnB protein